MLACKQFELTSQRSGLQLQVGILGPGKVKVYGPEAVKRGRESNEVKTSANGTIRTGTNQVNHVASPSFVTYLILTTVKRGVSHRLQAAKFKKPMAPRCFHRRDRTMTCVLRGFKRRSHTRTKSPSWRVNTK